MTFSVPMALEDYVPVVCAGFGFYWLADTLSRAATRARTLARLGVLLVTSGGVSKATWKLLMALSEGARDIVILDKALFFLLAAGFSCLALALLSERRGWVDPIPFALGWVLIVVVIAAVLYAQGSRSYRAVLLSVIVLGNTTTLVLAIRAALRRGLPLAALLIGAYLVTGFIMPALSRLEQTVSQQWLEQIVNSTGALCLVAGSFWLRRGRVASPEAQR